MAVNSPDARAFARAVGFYLHARRRDLGWSQAEFARAMGVAESTVSRTERAVRPLDMARLCEWCGALGVSPAELVALAQRRALPFGWRP